MWRRSSSPRRNEDSSPDYPLRDNSDRVEKSDDLRTCRGVLGEEVLWVEALDIYKKRVFHLLMSFFPFEFRSHILDQSEILVRVLGDPLKILGYHLGVLQREFTLFAYGRIETKRKKTIITPRTVLSAKGLHYVPAYIDVRNTLSFGATTPQHCRICSPASQSISRV